MRRSKECKHEGFYHKDHGCGVAVLVGSSYADHAMRCDIVKSPLYTPSYINHEQGIFPSNNSVSKNKEASRYLPWEAPAGECPTCYHDSLTPKVKKEK